MFVQLETKTVYTFMESLVDISNYIAKGKQLGYRTLGIMDRDNLYAAYHFMTEAQSAGINPVIGLSTALTYQDELIEFRLVALNTSGYKHLMKLSTEIMSGITSLDSLLSYFEDLLVIVPYFDGIETKVFPFDITIGVTLQTPQKKFDYPLVPLFPLVSFEEKDRETLQVLRAIKDNVQLNDVLTPVQSSIFLEPDDLEMAFEKRFPGAVAYLETITSNITYDCDTKLKLPRFNRSKKAHLEIREKTYKGLQEKQLMDASYIERLNKELSVIHDMGFDDYFLIVCDLISFGRRQGYYMGMGRGSAAGSLVAYALSITGIDPIKHQLLFERFLNAERYTMPDIDIDLPDIYRSEFLHYVRERYGSEHVAQIVTFSTFGAKQAIRDVFKRYGASEYELKNLTQKVGFRDNLKSVYERNISFRQLINSKIEYQRAYEIAKQIEGKPRQTSIHAAGVVMSDDLLTDHVPLKMGVDMMVTQYDAKAVEANGLLKMDFLGLRNLTFVQKMRDKVLKVFGENIDIASINLEDRETLMLFAAGNTKGIFQFEQSGAINLLRRIKPSCFEEVVATTSLNRPGASDYIDNFISRKNGHEAVDLIDSTIASIIAPTYGIMLYQEQVMQIAQVYAGFTLGKSDILRRAMSKKNVEDMQKMQADFLQGAERLGHSTKTATRLFNMMSKFAGYGFNRSHAFAYSALAFQMAYFKVHYPSIFYEVMLNDSSSVYLTDALSNGFLLAKLSINRIPYKDKLSSNKIYIGLQHLKSCPREMAFWVIENRPFVGIEDFLTRLPERFRKTDFILPLIKVGLFDEFEPNRRKIESNLSHLLLFVQELGSLFSESSYHWIEEEDYQVEEKYKQEVAILGVGISPHPLSILLTNQSRSVDKIADLVENQKVTILGALENIKVIRTKSNGQQMAFLTVTDLSSHIEVIVFPELFQKVVNQLKVDHIYYFKGRVQERNNRLQLLLTNIELATTEKCWIQLANHEYDSEVAEVLKRYPGNLPVILHYEDSHKTIQSSVYCVKQHTKQI